EGVSGSRTRDEDEQDDGPALKEQTSPLSGDEGLLANNNAAHSSPVPETSGKRESPLQSPDISCRDDLNFCSSPDTEDTADTVKLVLQNHVVTAVLLVKMESCLPLHTYLLT
ncbi:hypothetical protein CHARACLAT_030288, partial [Characodon lateralis]|nr:hypothetical protein [Characodon lateralis]